MAATITIDLLGGVEISGADPAQQPLSSRAVALLAYLVSHAESAQPRAHLAELLWPASGSAQARTNLRRELHLLRALLHDTSCLHVDGQSLSWIPGPDIRVDVQDFLVARTRVADALDAGDHVAVEKHAGGALAHYRGDFLPGCYDDWALAIRDELRHSCVELCDRIGAYWLANDDPATAVRFARRRVQLEPLEEVGYRLLITAQRSDGDRAGAMRTYHRCASIVERELGVGPSAETRAEFDALLAEIDDQVHAPAAERAAYASASRLVGRDVERARLASAWQQARSGECRLVVVSGRSGVGKTRLLDDLAGSVHGQDAVAVKTRCFAGTRAIPMAPVADWLSSPQLRSVVPRLDPVWRAEVERLVPEEDLTREPGSGTRAKVDAWQRRRFFEGLARAVLALERPVLLLVDDLQWSDRATLSWLSFLLSFARSAPILVVATARTEDLGDSTLPETVKAMQHAGQAATLNVENLGRDDAAVLAELILGRTPSTAELELLVSATGGNPFYLIEAARDASSRDAPLGEIDVRGVLSSRLSHLAEPVREVSALASAVGRDFTLDLLSEASDLDEETVVRAVDDLWSRRIFTESGRGYDFAHDLLREATYETIGPPRRWLLHRRLAQALELLYPDRLDAVAAQLADQYDRSGRPDRAIPFYERAARQATDVFAHGESVRLRQRCLDLLGEQPGGRQRDARELAILQELLPPLNAWRGYASPELERAERRTTELGERLGLVEVRCTAAIALFATTFVQGHTAESHQWGRRALALAEQRPDLLAQAHLGVAGSALSLGDVASSDEHFRSACDLAGASDSLPIGTRTAVHAASWWAHARWLRGNHVGAAATAVAAVKHAREIEHPYSLTVALSYAAITRQLLGDLPALRGILAELTDLCERYGFAYYREWATVLTGWVDGGASGPGAARQGIDALAQEGALARMPYWLWLVADLHRRDGDDESAVAALDAALARATENDDRWWLPEVLHSRAALAEPPDRTRLLEKAAALARSQGSTTLLDRIQADLAHGLDD